jgi:hypothetical protein
VGHGRPVSSGDSMPVAMSAKDIRVGQEIGCLQVVGRAPNRGKHVVWICRCRCGRTKNVFASNLARNPANRCTCSRKMNAEQRSVQEIYHGIVRRTTNSNCRSYPRYGGRGIKMCERWRQSFAHFIEDMGPRPSPKHSIERKDNDGDYCPGNCVWATRTVQGRNTSANHRLTYFGLTLAIAEWAERTGLSQYTIRRRVSVYGWPVGLALYAPALTHREMAIMSNGSRHE